MTSLFLHPRPDLGRFAAAAMPLTLLGSAFRDLPDLPLQSGDIVLPPPTPRPEAPAFDDRHTRRHRLDVLWLRRHGRRYLAPGELAFTADLAQWRAPLTIPQADRLAALVDRVDDQRRGRL